MTILFIRALPQPHVAIRCPVQQKTNLQFLLLVTRTPAIASEGEFQLRPRTGVELSLDGCSFTKRQCPRFPCDIACDFVLTAGVCLKIVIEDGLQLWLSGRFLGFLRSRKRNQTTARDHNSSNHGASPQHVKISHGSVSFFDSFFTINANRPRVDTQPRSKAWLTTLVQLENLAQ